ncbi:hypothetical protein BKA56DRAFT_625574 [Ilyonectria sp. MPI-CAGE-AT-0026]|nr:hypothetical protein BKA56DRAFT_625574 [Ilyonectria sp. MPI-CAGE-AT-0026]
MVVQTVSRELTVPGLHKSITDKLVSFKDGRTELSGQEEADIRGWKDWLGSSCNYTKRKWAMQHIGDAWRANPVLCLLIMLVAKPTWLGKLKPRDNFGQFRAWWSEVHDSDEGIMQHPPDWIEGGRQEILSSTSYINQFILSDMDDELPANGRGETEGGWSVGS